MRRVLSVLRLVPAGFRRFLVERPSARGGAAAGNVVRLVRVPLSPFGRDILPVDPAARCAFVV